MLRMKETRHLFGETVRTIEAGTEFEPGDELVKAHSDWFETVPVDHESDDTKKSTPRKRGAAKKDEDEK
jgi:hypothetical protein